MEVNSHRVIELLRDNYPDVVFNPAFLAHAAETMRSDPQGYRKLRKELTDTGNLDAVRFDAAVAEAAAGVPMLSGLRYSADEIAGLPLTSGCIVQNYLYRDLAILAAPGGAGKTTIVLFEMICIALGRQLWGLEVESPGRCVLVTAEDSRAKCGARLHRLMEDMGLTPAERDTVLDSVNVWDVRGLDKKLVCTDKDIVLTTLADRIVQAWQDQGVVLLTFDPLVAFGADEERVNSNAAALVTAGVRISNGLNCCVRYIHHTGQAVARDGTTDQYAGRGGSALSDGARMVAVLQRREHDHKDVPRQLLPIDPTSSLTVLARPKLTDCPPNQPEIWIERTGFRFHHCWSQRETQQQRLDRAVAEVVAAIRRELGRGIRHSVNSAETEKLYLETKLSRADFRDGVQQALRMGRLQKVKIPKAEREHPKKDTYLVPAENSAGPAG